MKCRLVSHEVARVAVRSVAPSTVPASRSMLVVALTMARGLLRGLVDYDRRAGGHWNGLAHPGLSLEVGLLGVRSGALVEEGLIRIVVASHHR